MISIPGKENIMPVIIECSECEHKETCEAIEYKNQGYCYIYKDKE